MRKQQIVIISHMHSTIVG